MSTKIGGEKEEMLHKKNIKQLLPKVACSKCKTEYDALELVRQEDGLLVLRVKCSCGKGFGMALLGLDLSELSESLEDVGEVQKPIDYDDVLDAHKYFKDIDANWSKFISGRKE